MDNHLFFYLLASIIVINSTNYVFLIPILPDFLQKKEVSLSLVGVILSFYQISHIITALYLSKNLVKFSKYKVMMFGQIVLITSNLSMCILQGISSIPMIFLFSCVIRFLQGMSYPLVVSTIYTFVPTLFKDEMQKKFAFLEIVTGLGLSLGPVIGGILYGNFGFNYCFVIISFVYLFAGICIFPFIKAKIENIQNEGLLGDFFEEINQNKSNSHNNELNILKIFTNKNFLLTFFVFIISYMSYSVIQPGFSSHIHSYNYSDEAVGILFGLGDLTYALTGIFIMNIANKINNKRKQLFFFGGLLSLLSLFILGPEKYSFLPRNIEVVTVGILILGASQMFYIPIIIPEFIEIFNEIDPKARGKEEMASGFFSAGLSVTLLLGSILGGILTDCFGFDRGMSIYALFIFGYLITYWKYRENKKNNLDFEMEMRELKPYQLSFKSDKR